MQKALTEMSSQNSVYKRNNETLNGLVPLTEMTLLQNPAAPDICVMCEKSFSVS